MFIHTIRIMDKIESLPHLLHKKNKMLSSVTGLEPVILSSGN